ncbi:ATP-NAD kinase [Pluteus cervinus]|uniref:ATP-NAD kinase n=1 Tax=Pluteus cervinus TaxID=181527 RepID=A0ACD3BCI8_9AGAR|nr:ATP-NAD kinase [Pluteus cervinus]
MAQSAGHELDLSSPGVEIFSTPPSTPNPPMDSELRPSFVRKSSRPSSLALGVSQAEWNPNIQLEESSPVVTRKSALSPPDVGPAHAIANRIPAAMPPSNSNSDMLRPSPPIDYHNPMASPCFVHSQLDKGVSLTEWLRNRQKQALERREVNVAQSLQHQETNGHDTGIMSSPQQADLDDEEDNFGGSLTKQLAETATSVREWSKQLGRARVRYNIQSILIITKARDNRLIKLTREIALYLMLKRRPGQSRGLTVYVDNQLRKSKRFDAEGIEREHPDLFVPFPRRRTSSNSLSSNSSSSTHRDDTNGANGKEEGQLRYWTSSMCSNSPHLFDFVITLGGDGTVLFTSWLFQRIVPPVLPFALGSLGFLTNFDFADHQAVMDSVIDNGIRINLRMRFTCTVYRAVGNESGKKRKAVKKGETGEILMKNIEKGGWEALEGGWAGHPEGKLGAKDKEIKCFVTRPAETFEVLNDLVVDRGPSPYVSLLELFGDEHHMTTVQADGLTVSTPTGSTAYSLSAGGSLVHPEIPALLITPICPHTLSFRPMLLPDSMELRICVPYNSRSTAWASFDGRGRVELKQGDHIKVTASRYPFPTVCADKQSTDWFHSISRTLKWNERERQKSFVVVEEGPEKKTKKQDGEGDFSDVPNTVEEIDDEEDEVSDEEDKFDIDDSSPENEVQNNPPPVVTLQQAGSSPVYNSEQEDRRVPRSAALKKAHGRTSKSRSRSRGHVNFREPTSEIASPSPAGVSFSARSHRFDAEAARTPTLSSLHSRVRAGSRSGESTGHRAFAVWGHDESDSCASDSDLS